MERWQCSLNFNLVEGGVGNGPISLKFLRKNTFSSVNGQLLTFFLLNLWQTDGDGRIALQSKWHRCNFSNLTLDVASKNAKHSAVILLVPSSYKMACTWSRSHRDCTNPCTRLRHLTRLTRLKLDFSRVSPYNFFGEISKLLTKWLEVSTWCFWTIAFIQFNLLVEFFFKSLLTWIFVKIRPTEKIWTILKERFC